MRQIKILQTFLRGRLLQTHNSLTDRNENSCK